MWSCQPPTQTVYCNQCRLWWRETRVRPGVRVQVRAVYCMHVSQRPASLIKVARAARAARALVVAYSPH